MVPCSHPECSWRAIAPSEDAAWTQYAAHLVEEHSRTADVDIPDGMVQVKLGEDEEWITATMDEAKELHRSVHDD